MPNVSRVAFLRNPASPAHVRYFNDLQGAGRELRVTMQSVEVQEPSELESAFAAMMRERPDALIVTADPAHQLRLGWIVDFAAKRRLPAMYQLKEYCCCGRTRSSSRPAARSQSSSIFRALQMRVVASAAATVRCSYSETTCLAS